MSAWVPLMQTGLWVAVCIVLAVAFRKVLLLVLETLVARIQAGAPVTLGPVKIESAPTQLQSGKLMAVTSDGSRGVEAPAEVRAILDEGDLPDELSDDLCLLHSAEIMIPWTGPGTGRYRVRAWLEGYADEFMLDEITRVTYRLHETFKQRLVSTESRKAGFEIWLNVYGEFTLVAYIERKNKPSVWLTRYLDLPGRPTN